MNIPITFRDTGDLNLEGGWPASFTITCTDMAGGDLTTSLTTDSTMYEIGNGSYVINAPNLSQAGYLKIALTSRPTLTWYETWFDVSSDVLSSLSIKIRNLMLRG